MGWRDRLQPASYKGVAFHVEGTGSSGGRRVVLKRLAGGGGIVPVDLDEEAPEFDVTAFVVGEDYDLQRDALERAIREGGPGTLVLPTRGAMRARVTRGPQTTESRTEGGFATIRFTVFREDAEATGLRAQPDTASQLKTASAAVAVAAKADAAASARTTGLTRAQFERVSGIVQEATAVIRRATRYATLTLTPVTSLTRDLDALNQSLVNVVSLPDLLATTVLDLVFTAYSIPQTAVGGVERLAGVAGIATTAFGRGRAARMVDRIAAAFRGFGEPFTAHGTGSQQRQAEEARMSVARLVRASSLAASASAYADVAFDSSTFALGTMNRSLEEIDAVQLLGPTDALFAALDDLRAALARHFYESASQLPETITIELSQPTPALLLAHVLYGDARLEEDLIARNGIEDPLFVRGKLEALRP